MNTTGSAMLTLGLPAKYFTDQKIYEKVRKNIYFKTLAICLSCQSGAQDGRLRQFFRL